METITKITNITVVENTVMISLSRYEELLSKEKQTQENVIYTKKGWFNNEFIFTNDKAIKEISIDLRNALAEVEEIKEQNQILKRHNIGLKAKNNYSWQEIFIILKNKI